MAGSGVTWTVTGTGWRHWGRSHRTDIEHSFAPRFVIIGDACRVVINTSRGVLVRGPSLDRGEVPEG